MIEMNMDKIVALCKKYKVAKLWVFGSIITPPLQRRKRRGFLGYFPL